MRKSNQDNQKRYVTIGILLLLAAAIGTLRCCQQDPEDISEVKTGQSSTSMLEKPGCSTEGTGTATSRNAFRIDHTHSKGTQQKTYPRKVTEDQREHLINITAQSGRDTATTTTEKSEEPQQEPTAAVEWQVSTTVPSENTPESAGKPTASVSSDRFPHHHLFRLGIRVGAGYSRITGLGNILQSYDVRPQFTMDEKGVIVPRLGLFATWQYHRLGLELGVDYTQFSSKVTEQQLSQEFCEKTTFHYDVVASQLLFRFYVLPQFYMGAGITTVIPFGKRNIDYTNNLSGQVYRQQQELSQDHLRQTLKSRVLFMPTIKIGYTLPHQGLEAALEYSYGVNDLIHTPLPNDYGYQERKNNVHYFGFTIGYSIPLYHRKEEPSK